MRISDWSSDVCSSDLYPVRVTRAAARSADPGRTIGRRRRTPVAAGKLRLIGDRAMLHAIRKAGIGGLPAEVEIRLARMADRPFADLVAGVEKRGLALDLLARLGRNGTARRRGRTGRGHRRTEERRVGKECVRAGRSRW